MAASNDLGVYYVDIDSIYLDEYGNPHAWVKEVLTDRGREAAVAKVRAVPVGGAGLLAVVWEDAGTHVRLVKFDPDYQRFEIIQSYLYDKKGILLRNWGRGESGYIAPETLVAGMAEIVKSHLSKSRAD